MTTKAPSKEAMAAARRVHVVDPGAVAVPCMYDDCPRLLELPAALETFAKQSAIAERDALRERNRKLSDAAHTVADKYDIYVTESVIDIAKAGYKTRPATKHARLELSEAVDAMLAADAEAAPSDYDNGDGDNDTREILFRAADAKAGEGC